MSVPIIGLQIFGFLKIPLNLVVFLISFFLSNDITNSLEILEYYYFFTIFFLVFIGLIMIYTIGADSGSLEYSIIILYYVVVFIYVFFKLLIIDYLIGTDITSLSPDYLSLKQIIAFLFLFLF